MALMSQKKALTGPQKKNDVVRRAVEKIVKSKSFRQLDRLQRFLIYIVEETLEGRADRLKEYPVGVEVFGRDATFDPRMDPIVRVQARRLRLRLAAYYTEEGQNETVIVELPKGGYAPLFRSVERGLPARKMVSAALVSKNTIAILPFEDLSPDHDERHFCQGIQKEIIQALAKFPSLIVKSGSTADVRDSVALLVEGSVRKKQGTLRITTHLVDTLRGSYIWTETLDRPPDDDFAVQEEIASRVAQVLEAGADDAATQFPSVAGRTSNLAAYNLYLQGRYHIAQRSEHGLRKAIEFFSRAIEEDPRMASAYAGLSDAHVLLGHYGFLAPVEVWTKSAALAAQAVLLDDQSSDAHTSLAHVRASQDWDWTGAESEFQKAIGLNPHNATAHLWFGISSLASQGRLDEALIEVKTAQALDPVSFIVTRNIALMHYYQRNYELALQFIDSAIELNPQFSSAYWTLGMIQEQRGELDESVAAFKRAIELAPASPRPLGALGAVLAKDGRKDEARRILDQIDELSTRRYVSSFEPAVIHFNLGQRDVGFELLGKAFADRCFEVMAIHADPRFDAIRSDARYKALVQKLKLPQ